MVGPTSRILQLQNGGDEFSSTLSCGQVQSWWSASDNLCLWWKIRAASTVTSRSRCDHSNVLTFRKHSEKPSRNSLGSGETGNTSLNRTLWNYEKKLDIFYYKYKFVEKKTCGFDTRKGKTAGTVIYQASVYTEDFKYSYCDCYEFYTWPR